MELFLNKKFNKELCKEITSCGRWVFPYFKTKGAVTGGVLIMALWCVKGGRQGEREQRFLSRLQLNPSVVKVRDLGFRWGSCGAKGTLNFN